MTKEKRCLKFTGYIYLPDEDAEFNDLRYSTARTTGRLIIFDEHNKKKNEKAIAFDNLGLMLDHIETERKKRILKRVKKKHDYDYNNPKAA